MCKVKKIIIYISPGMRTLTEYAITDTGNDNTQHSNKYVC